MASSAFLRYCKTLARTGSPVASEARACVRIGGRDPSTCRNRLARDLDAGTIDTDSHEYRLGAVDTMATLYADRDRIYETLGADYTGWASLGNGGRMRLDVVYESTLEPRGL